MSLIDDAMMITKIEGISIFPTRIKVAQVRRIGKPGEDLSTVADTDINTVNQLLTMAGLPIKTIEVIKTI